MINLARNIFSQKCCKAQAISTSKCDFMQLVQCGGNAPSPVEWVRWEERESEEGPITLSSLEPQKP